MRTALALMALVAVAAVCWALWTQYQVRMSGAPASPPAEVQASGPTQPQANASTELTPASTTAPPPSTLTPQDARAQEIAQLIEARDRALAAAKIAQDQMAGARPSPAPPTTTSTSSPTLSRGDVAARIRAVSETDWSAFHDALARLMVGSYDADRSGDIDSGAEVSSVPCDVVRALNARLTGFHSSGDISMRPIYGFAEGYGWVGHTLGYNEAVRGAADRHFAGCGISG